MGLLGYLLDFQAISVFHFLACGSLLAVLLSVMEAVKGGEDVMLAICLQRPHEMQLAIKDDTLSTCTEYMIT